MEATEAEAGLARAELGAEADTVRAMKLLARSTRDAIVTRSVGASGDCVCIYMRVPCPWPVNWARVAVSSSQWLTRGRNLDCRVSVPAPVCRGGVLRFADGSGEGWIKGTHHATLLRVLCSSSKPSMRTTLCPWLPPAYKRAASTMSRSGSRIITDTRCGVDKLTAAPITSPYVVLSNPLFSSSSIARPSYLRQGPESKG